jgi:hypothetical protein
VKKNTLWVSKVVKDICLISSYKNPGKKLKKSHYSPGQAQRVPGC